MFLTEISDYGPYYATSYYYHPLAAIFVGPWTAPFEPWTAYWVFVGASVLMLAFSAWILGTAFEDRAQRAFAYFALFCTLPTYLMLWNAQLHVLLIVAMALILAGLMRLAQEPEADERYLRWIQVGLLISLFSKPTVILMFPVLFVMPETRRKLVGPVVIYAVVSLLFLWVPRLNPGSYNAQHWLNILAASSSPLQIYRLVHPIEYDYSGNSEIYSLPMLLLRTWDGPVPLWIFKLPLAAIVVASLSPLVLPERSRRFRAAVVAVALCILSHYLCYFLAYEYHYTTLLPLLPVVLWLRRYEELRWMRWLLATVFAALCTIFLPTPFFLSENIKDYWMACALERVAPVCLSFLLLTVYSAAMAWRGIQGQWGEIRGRVVSQLRAADRPAAVVGILMATVLTAALVTSPDRLLASPADWSADEWKTHLEDIASRPGIGPMAMVSLHYSMATIYAKSEPALARRHYLDAKQIVLEHPELSLATAGVLIENNLYDAAAELIADIPPDKLATPELRQQWETFRKEVQAKQKKARAKKKK